MKSRRYFTILLIISTILTTANCANKKGRSLRSRLPKLPKFSIGKILNTNNGNNFKNWNSSNLNNNKKNINRRRIVFSQETFSKNNSTSIGYAPIIKENDTQKLEKILHEEADLIKISAFNRINQLSNGPNANQKKFILLKLEGIIELIKYYGVAYNCPMVKFTFAQGLYYVYRCRQIHGKDPGDCLLKYVRLLESFIFSHKVEENRIMRYWFKKTKEEAEIYFKHDPRIQYVDARIACEIKLTQENKNIFLKAALRLIMGDSKHIPDCVSELNKYENQIEIVGSFPAEYRYLLARAYSHAGKEEETLNNLLLARDEVVKDSKTRHVNNKVQQYLEKQYTRFSGNKKLDLIQQLIK